MTLVYTFRFAYVLQFLLLAIGLKGYSDSVIFRPTGLTSSDAIDESKDSHDAVEGPVLRPLTEEAQRLTRLRAGLLQPTIRRDAALTHPVDGYELVEQSLAKPMRPQTIPVRPFAVETPRHVFQRQRTGPNFVLPIVMPD
jgi:hypothetical protein